MPRRDRAGADAGRHAIGGIEGLVVDAVDAERAFAHDADILVELARAVGAGPGAELAADAEELVDQHDAVLCALEAGAGRADGDAGGIGAMQAGFGEVDGAAGLVVALLEGMDAVEPDAVGLGAIGLEIGERPGAAAGVPLLAIDRAGVTADADVEIDDEPELLLSRRHPRQARHRRPPAPSQIRFTRETRRTRRRGVGRAKRAILRFSVISVSPW